ncbi:hypothetical protein ACFV2W_28315 [Streptomyces cellulosae]
MGLGWAGKRFDGGDHAPPRGLTPPRGGPRARTRPCR